MLYPATGVQYDVLTQTVPDRSGSVKHNIKREQSVIRSAMGVRRVVDKFGVPVITRDFVWYAYGRDEIAQLRAFVSARKGRVIPVWVPTYQRDMQLARPCSQSEQQIDILGIRYSAMVFPTGNARRHLAVIFPDESMQLYGITGAVDNGDGTETLVLNTPLATDLPQDAMLSFLTLCRLTNDTVKYTWHTPTFIEATLSFTELPKEAPSP